MGKASAGQEMMDMARQDGGEGRLEGAERHKAEQREGQCRWWDKKGGAEQD